MARLLRCIHRHIYTNMHWWIHLPYVRTKLRRHLAHLVFAENLIPDAIVILVVARRKYLTISRLMRICAYFRAAEIELDSAGLQVRQHLK